MRLLTYGVNGGSADSVGALVDGRVVALSQATVIEAVAAHMVGELDVSSGQDAGAVGDLRLGPPIPAPTKIVCVGLNYRDHASETQMDVPDVPLLFAKYPSSLTGPEDAIELPSLTRQLDWEAELAVVMGRRVRDVPEDQALGAVAGYMAFNDVSARDVQLEEGGQWTRGKSLDTFGPSGPWLLTADEVPDPQVLEVRCSINGEVMQDSSTEHMIFPVAHLVSFISRAMTLMPGDIIATGTPPGVGMGRRPPVYLRDGDQVEVEVSGLGCQRNRVVAGS